MCHRKLSYHLNMFVIHECRAYKFSVLESYIWLVFSSRYSTELSSLSLREATNYWVACMFREFIFCVTSAFQFFTFRYYTNFQELNASYKPDLCGAKEANSQQNLVVIMVVFQINRFGNVLSVFHMHHSTCLAWGIHIFLQFARYAVSWIHGKLLV